MAVTLPYLETFRDRHGKQRYYYRRKGMRVPFQSESGTPEFFAEYSRIHASFEAPSSENTPGTFGHLVATYYASPEFGGLRPTSKDTVKRHLEHMRGKLGKIRLTGINKQVAIKYRDSLREHPRTANNALAYLKQILNFAVEHEMVPMNLAATVKRLRDDGEGWQPWPEAVLERFAKESKGVPRTAYYLALYTGQRQADCLSMRWDAIKNGGILVKQQKTRKEIWIPLHPKLAAEIERVSKEDAAKNEARLAEGKAAIMSTTILHRNDGQRFTKSGFGSLWNREQHRLDCTGNPMHGLRKNAVIALLEAGCTVDQVKAITGHTTDDMVAFYGKMVNQKKLARQAMKKLVEGASEEQDED